MVSPTTGVASPTYQCVVCQSTCLTPNELHRHQSYRHTSEELSLSIIGVHNAAIRTYDLPNGIVYDNSWLYDPNRHAQFYTYSANMLCDENNNGGVVDYAFKAFEDRVVEESGPAAVPDDDCTHDLDRCIGEKYENDNFAEAQNFERGSWLGESKILDLRLKIDLEVESENRMDTAKDNFWISGEGHSEDSENLGREDEKSASSETRVKSLNSEELQTCVLDGLASKILDLGRKVFLETRTDTAADDFGNRYEGSQSEKSKDPQIETCMKVQNFDEPQSCVQESEILDLSRKFCSEVQSGTPMNAAADNFGKRYKELRSDVGNLRGETAKLRLSPSKCPAKSKARKLTMPRKKPDGPKREAAKPKNTENKESGNVDSVKQEWQDSLSWFESEASKIKKYNDKTKQIRAGQKKALDLTKLAQKQVKGEGSAKAKKRTMQSRGRGDSVRLSGNFDSEELLGFDGKGAMINATCSTNAERSRVSRKKGKICELEADKSAEETAELLKKPLDRETAGETGIFRSDQSLLNLKRKKSQIHAPTVGKAKKPRVSKKKGKISGTAADNSADETAELLKKLFQEETAGETLITQNRDNGNGNRAEQSSIFGSVESTIRFDSKEAKIDAFAAESAKRPIASQKKARNSKIVPDKSTERETTKPANQNCAKEVGPQPNGDFESADFLARTDGDGQKINATCAEKAGARAEKAAVEVTAELLRDLLTVPSEKETPRMTEKLQNEDCGNEDYAADVSFFNSDEYLYYFPSEEANLAAVSSGRAKKPIGSGKKTNDLKPATVWPAKQKMTRKIVNDGNGNSSKQRSGSSRDVFSYTGKESEEAKVTPPMASRKKSDNLKTVTVWAAKQKLPRKIVNDGNGNSSKQSSCSTLDVFSYTGSESEEAAITPLSKFRAERSSALGKKLKKINAGDENCAGHVSHFVPNIYTCADRATKKVETLNSFGKNPRKMNQGVENCAERNSNFVPNIYTCTDRASKRVKTKGPSAEKPKRRRVASKKSKNSETVSDKEVVKNAARGTTKLFYQDFGTKMFVSQNSPPIIDVNSSTESGSEEAMPRSSSAGNIGKAIVAKNKPKNVKTPEVEAALRENNKNREHDNVISLYKDSSPIPGGSAACDRELPPVTFVAYPPYVDENSILVLNPESRELVWRCLQTEDSQLDDAASFHWLDRGSPQNFSGTGKATTSRKVDSEKSPSFVPAAIGAPASNEESTLRRTNIVRRSTRPRKVIQRYNS